MSGSSYQTLQIEREPPVLRVWLNRPERLNALNTAALEEIADLFGGLQRDFETKAVVLGGRGRSFCSGADRKAPPASEHMGASSGASERQRRYASQLGLRATRAIQECETPTVCRIQGHAIGGGFVLAIACDFRIASTDAVFHVPEVDLGLPLTWGATPRLIHELGASRARELILMCDRIDAVRAEQWGVVHRVVAPDELDKQVEQWAERLAAKPEVAVHMTKTQFRAYEARAAQGDVRESDGDLLVGSSRVGTARRSFAPSTDGSSSE